METHVKKGVKLGSINCGMWVASVHEKQWWKFWFYLMSCKRKTRKELWCVSDNCKTHQEGEMGEMTGTHSTKPQRNVMID
jgi:hypothetical protein